MGGTTVTLTNHIQLVVHHICLLCSSDWNMTATKGKMHVKVGVNNSVITNVNKKLSANNAFVVCSLFQRPDQTTAAQLDTQHR